MLVLAPPGKRLRFEGSLLLAVLRGHIPLLYHMSSHCLRLDLFARSFAGGYTGPLAGSKLMPCGGGLNGVDKSPYGLELQQDAGGEFFDTEESPIWARPSQSQCSPSISPQKNVRISEGSANVLKQRPPTGLPRDPSRSISQEMEPHCADLVASLNLSRSEESACETGVSNLKKQLGSGKVVSVADANGTSSFYSSVR